MPHSIYVATSFIQIHSENKTPDQSETRSGKCLLKYMISEKLNNSDTEFTTLKYEKPIARAGGRPVSVSFSHTNEAVSAAISDFWVVGIDMESAERQVGSSLAERMKHKEETLKFYDEYPIIQIWTMKEAALKAIGTGLRKPMNSVRLEAISNYLFNVEFYNGTTAEICSLNHAGQYISICYISSKLSESFLSESYVPIHSRRD